MGISYREISPLFRSYTQPCSIKHLTTRAALIPQAGASLSTVPAWRMLSLETVSFRASIAGSTMPRRMTSNFVYLLVEGMSAQGIRPGDGDSSSHVKGTRRYNRLQYEQGSSGCGEACGLDGDLRLMLLLHVTGTGVCVCVCVCAWDLARSEGEAALMPA
jgi:hypothetical protein